MRIMTAVILSLLFILSGCSAVNEGMSGNVSENVSENAGGKGEYVRISAEEAKMIIDSEEDVIILDVRTQSEYDSGYIRGALLLPYDRIDVEADTVLPDKNAKILIYCRSGNRSAIAARALLELGYTDVTDFGGIIDWPYEVVSE